MLIHPSDIYKKINCDTGKYVISSSIFSSYYYNINTLFHECILCTYITFKLSNSIQQFRFLIGILEITNFVANKIFLQCQCDSNTDEYNITYTTCRLKGEDNEQ